MDDYRYKALRALTRARFGVVQNLTREKQRFANYLFLKCSGMAQDKDIQNTSATTIALMERFETVDDLANACRFGVQALFQKFLKAELGLVLPICPYLTVSARFS